MTITIEDFKGINNVSSENRLPINFLRECVNLNITGSGIAEQRDGFTSKISGEFTALWSDGLRCFAVMDGDLTEIKRVNNDYTHTTLHAGIGRINASFTECDGDYYYCSTAGNGVISEATIQTLIGKRMVEKQPTIAAVDGGILLAGKYLVAITTLDNNGVESGTTAPVLFELLEDAKGLQLSVFPDTNQPYYAIYVSTRNGTELFRQGVINSSTPTVIIYDVDDSTLPLDSIGVIPAHYGELIAYNYGHLFIARDNRLYYSYPMQYGRWSDENYYEYASKITAIMPCENGLWISTSKSGTYWISGKTPDHDELQGDFSQSKKMNNSIFQGSQQRVEADRLNQMSHGWIATAKDGIFILLDGGQFINATLEIANLPQFDSCAGALIEHDDSLNYLSIIKGAKVPPRSI